MGTQQPLSTGRLLFTGFYVLLWPAFILALSGDWLWPEGWLFGGWFLAVCLATILYLYRKDPALLAERFRKPGTGEQKPWDRFMYWTLALGFAAWITLIPLDSKRFGWSTGFPVSLKCLGGVCLSLSFFFLYRSFTDNTFLSPLIRIQTERRQQLVTTGVYGFVRHPMYLGALLMFVGAPLLMSSSVGIGLGLVLTFLLARRALGEEKMMTEELTGYPEYQKKVKYRFIPFIW